MAKYLTELIGTFFLVFTIALCVIQGVALAPLAIGAVLMVMVYMGGHISGAHYNPAVSLAMLVRGQISLGDCIAYIIAQLAGAMLATYVAFLVTGGVFAAAPSEGVLNTSALLVEVLYTFALVIVIFNVAVSKATEGNNFYGLAIGFTIAGAAAAGGGISGGAYNPAVGVGPALISTLLGQGDLGHVWLYLVGPIAGGLLAALVFGLQDSGE